MVRCTYAYSSKMGGFSDLKTLIVGKCLLPSLLRRSGITQTCLSDKTGISVSQLSMYINNKRMMSLQTAMLIAWALHCHIEELYEYIVQ